MRVHGAAIDCNVLFLLHDKAEDVKSGGCSCPRFSKHWAICTGSSPRRVESLRQCVAKGLVGGAILYTDPTHIKAKADKHKKKLVEVAATPKAYLS